MSPANKPQPFQFQTLQNKLINFSTSELLVIAGLMPLQGGEWDESISIQGGNNIVKTGSQITKVERDRLVVEIKNKLIAIQGPYCIYCGFHTIHCGVLEREHIAPKGSLLYPMFMFEPQNLCLACHKCNYDLKKSQDVASGNKINYSQNIFSIVHPYFDNIADHLELTSTNRRCILRVKNNSAKGIETIRMFQLASPERTTQRSAYLMEHELPQTARHDNRFIRAIDNKYMPK